VEPQLTGLERDLGYSALASGTAAGVQAPTSSLAGFTMIHQAHGPNPQSPSIRCLLLWRPPS